jgi:hypothetical protein
MKSFAMMLPGNKLRIIMSMLAVAICTATFYVLPFSRGDSNNVAAHGTAVSTLIPASSVVVSSRPDSGLECAPSCLEFTDHDCTTMGAFSLYSLECLPMAKPSRFIQVLIESILGTPLGGECEKGSPGGCSSQLPYNAERRKWGNDWPPFGYVMMGRVCLQNFRAAIEDVNRKRIPGSIIELGVWRGGGMMLAAAVNQESEIKRNLYVFDAFENVKNYGNHEKFLSVSEALVREGFKTFDLLDKYVHFEVGLFVDTLPKFHSNEKIAVLRVDANFYDSYQDACYFLYERVPVGGIIIFDDVLSHHNVMQFWTEFNEEQKLGIEKLIEIDKHSAWFRKPKDVVLDWRYFKAPKDANAHDGLKACPQYVQAKIKGDCHESWSKDL